MSYKHLSTIERSCLSIYVRRGISITAIAEQLKRDKSTISRELKRNREGDSYNPARAETRYRKLKQLSGSKRKIERGNELYKRIVNGLELDWSPEQIVHTVASDVSMSTIYRSFHNKTLSPYAKHFRILTYQRGWRKNHKRGNTYKGCRTIHERSKTATDRKEFGHWELDGLAFSRKETQSLAVFVERQTGYAITVLLPNQQSETMKAAIVDTFKKLPPDCRKTLTADRGKEFEQWKAIEAELPGTTVYFCDPARPQQKGTVENLNGLLRQYYPKNKKTLAPSAAELSIVQVNLNNRPRKRLCYATPYQMFFLAITK